VVAVRTPLEQEQPALAAATEIELGELYVILVFFAYRAGDVAMCDQRLGVAVIMGLEAFQDRVLADSRRAYQEVQFLCVCA
jgi:hypothetical protein